MPKTFTAAQILIMWELQDKVNIRIRGNDWKDQNLDWTQAIFDECAECANHFGWKWWAKQEQNMKQVHLELVDIWHFILSKLIADSRDEPGGDDFTEAYNDFLSYYEGYTIDTPDEFRCALRWLPVSASLSEALGTFFDLCAYVDLPPDSIFQLYLGKNVLNTFRQDNGYKQGSYTKIWDINPAGQLEDNDVMMGFLPELDWEKSYQEVMEEIYATLKSLYTQVPWNSAEDNSQIEISLDTM